MSTRVFQLAAVSSIALLALASVAGCARKDKDAGDGDGSLDSSSAALSSDNDESQEAEDGVEDGVEDGLSGAAPSDPGSPADGVDVAAIDLKIKTNPGAFFQPAGCIVSTNDAPGVWTHVFTSCTGPHGHVTYNGTIKSTWTAAAGQLSVKHEATDFSAAGPKVTVTFSGERDVTYSRTGTTIAKHRVGTWTGTISKNANPSKSEAWSHDADFTSTWDPTTKCYTRDGSAQNSIGDRQFGRTVTGFKVCGSIFACPDSGELEIDRKDGTVKITVTYVGNGEVEIVGPKGGKLDVKLVCDAS